MEGQFMTEHLLLLPGNNQRDNDPFLEMLRKDGDFRIYSGVAPTEKNILAFQNYFEVSGSCFYAIFEKEHRERFIGYVGIGYQHQRFEVEFYISKPYRNRGYCTEALRRLCEEAFTGNLTWIDLNGERTGLAVDKLYASAILENCPASRVIEKCGFIRNPEIVIVFQMLFDPDNDTVYSENIAEYVLEGR